MRVLYNDIMTEDITGSVPNAGYLNPNLNDTRLSRPVRWTDTALRFAEVDLGAAKSFNTVTLMSHNITNTATIQIKTGSTASFVTPIDTFTLTWEEKNLWAEVVLSSSAQYVRLEITDTANPDGYLNVGRLMLGNRYVMPGFAPVVSIDKIARGSATKSVSDQVYGQLKYRINRLSVQIPNISQSQIDAYDTYLAETGVSVAHALHLDESDTCSTNFTFKTLYVVNDKAAESLELNTAGLYTTRKNYSEVY